MAIQVRGERDISLLLLLPSKALLTSGKPANVSGKQAHSLRVINSIKVFILRVHQRESWAEYTDNCTDPRDPYILI